MRDYKLYIQDIKEVIDKIQLYIENIDLESFKNDSKTYDSVLHNFLIIGEAACKIPEEVQENYNEIDWRGMVGLRNIIAHGYFSIDPDIVWKTIKDDLPVLKEQIIEILQTTS
ncbi:MAG: DUF86 domain-containing protein [Spirochaetes bacterium]|nr:DUF86 domain-containing protein [Spirochaetota bacterium]